MARCPPEDTKRLQKTFLKAYIASGGQLNKAAKAAKISKNTQWLWREHNIHGFVKKFEQAKAIAAEDRESEAIRRARDGVREYLYTGRGEPILDRRGNHAFKHKFSDALLMFTLKADMPDKYGEKSNGPVVNNNFVTPEAMRDIRQGCIDAFIKSPGGGNGGEDSSDADADALGGSD